MKSAYPDYPPLIKEVRRPLSISREDPVWVLGVSHAAVDRRENDRAKPSKPARAQLHMLSLRRCERQECRISRRFSVADDKAKSDLRPKSTSLQLGVRLTPKPSIL